MIDVVRIQLHHARLERSNPYPAEIESALAAIKAKGLAERGWDNKNDPGVIRHETGAEIIVLVIGLIQLSTAILDLVAASKKHRPETTVSIQVDPTQLANVLRALGAPPNP